MFLLHITQVLYALSLLYRTSILPQQPKPKISKRESWLSHIEQVSIELDNLFDHEGVHQYIEGFCQRYIQDQSPDPIDEAIEKLDQWEKSSTKYCDKILNLSGVGKDWKQADGVRQRVSKTIRGLQEILMHGMVDIRDLECLYAQKELLFQSYY